ncbi:MAG: PAS domain-containing protein [Chloroflexota bacterium]
MGSTAALRHDQPVSGPHGCARGGLALTESEARFETVVGALREGVIVHDMDLNLLWRNPAAERLLGLTGDQLARRVAWDERREVIRPDGTRSATAKFPGEVAARTGRPVLGTTLGIRDGSGALRWVGGRGPAGSRGGRGAVRGGDLDLGCH